MNFLSVLEGKRDGQALSPDQIQEFVRAYTSGTIPDYQAAALLMAIYFRGFNSTETRALTLAMRDSGITLRFPEDSRPLVDKHSTGGIGDKVSLVLAPLLAGLGFRVPMISGRGLGITGGTLDKLDSIPGFQTRLPADRIIDIVQSVGCVICGQTDEMAPADRKLYALRDVTATVPSIPLIVASILSKKLAEGISALVLDVKFGTGAFMPDLKSARQLARAMVTLGNQCGVTTRALLTDMNVPLGRAAGNWLEVKEAACCLDPSSEPATRVNVSSRSHHDAISHSDSGPGTLEFGLQTADSPSDLRELVLTTAAHLLLQTRRARSIAAGREQARACLASGAPLQKWHEMLSAQGADWDAFRRILALESGAPRVVELKAGRTGYVCRCEARLIGELVRDLGGGRLTKDSSINHDVGVDRLRKPGERIFAGDTLARLHLAFDSEATSARDRLAAAFDISAKRPPARKVLAGVIS